MNPRFLRIRPFLTPHFRNLPPIGGSREIRIRIWEGSLRNRRWPVKNCERCGRRFYPRSNRQRFCRAECRFARRPGAAAVLGVRRCVGCFREFAVRAEHQRFAAGLSVQVEAAGRGGVVWARSSGGSCSVAGGGGVGPWCVVLGVRRAGSRRASWAGSSFPASGGISATRTASRSAGLSIGCATVGRRRGGAGGAGREPQPCGVIVLGERWPAKAISYLEPDRRCGIPGSWSCSRTCRSRRSCQGTSRRVWSVWIVCWTSIRRSAPGWILRVSTVRSSGTSPRTGGFRVTDPLLDARAAAELLGVPATWLLAQARRDAVPHVRLGKYVRFQAAELERWIETRKRGTS